MDEAITCVGCERSVAVGTRRYHGRVQYGDRFLCEECGDLLREPRTEPATRDRILDRIRDYGLGMAGGHTGKVGGPG